MKQSEFSNKYLYNEGFIRQISNYKVSSPDSIQSKSRTTLLCWMNSGHSYAEVIYVDDLVCRNWMALRDAFSWCKVVCFYHTEMPFTTQKCHWPYQNFITLTNLLPPHHEFQHVKKFFHIEPLLKFNRFIASEAISFCCLCEKTISFHFTVSELRQKLLVLLGSSSFEKDRGLMQILLMLKNLP